MKKTQEPISLTTTLDSPAPFAGDAGMKSTHPQQPDVAGVLAVDASRAIDQDADQDETAISTSETLNASGDFDADLDEGEPASISETLTDDDDSDAVPSGDVTSADSVDAEEQPGGPDDVKLIKMKLTSAEAAAQAELTAWDNNPFQFFVDEPPGPQTGLLCDRMAKSKVLYRTPEGNMLWLDGLKSVQSLSNPHQVEGFLRVRMPVEVIRSGKLVARSIPPVHFKVMLTTDVLQKRLPVVDKVTAVVTYTPAWCLTQPGYNPGVEGSRFYYIGKEVVPIRTTTCINQFLDVMSFRTPADRTNAVAFALTVLLRHLWPGQKPFGAVTANKSHAGKDTVIDFAAGRTARAEISYQAADWALQNEAVTALADLDVGLLSIGNIRSKGSMIESSWVERMVTSAKPHLQSTKRGGDGYKRPADFVLCASANNGRFSPDLANRSLPIHLEAVGDIATRRSAIGDPRTEYLPNHREEIEAEICGMVERWKEEGMPSDYTAHHPMKDWARTIGGILKVNGFVDFLGNWSFQRAANDVVRESLGILAQSTPRGRWMRVSELLTLVEDEGLVGDLIDRRHRESHKAMLRELGCVLSNHLAEKLHCQSDDGVSSFVVRRERRRDGESVATFYCFEPVETASKAD